MNLVVAMTAYRRPVHTARAIRALEIADRCASLCVLIDKFGDGEIQKDLRTIVNFTGNSLSCYCKMETERIGLWQRENVQYCAYQAAMEWNPVTEAILGIEDDCVLSPDAMALCRWFLELPERDDYLFLNLANCNRPEDCLGRELDVVESPRIVSPWAWCFTRRAWEEKIKPQWNHLTGEGGAPKGWDWSLSDSMEKNGWKSLMPVLPRAKNIGRDLGENGGAGLFDETLAKAAVSDGTFGTDFRLVK